MYVLHKLSLRFFLKHILRIFRYLSKGRGTLNWHQNLKKVNIAKKETWGPPWLTLVCIYILETSDLFQSRFYEFSHFELITFQNFYKIQPWSIKFQKPFTSTNDQELNSLHLKLITVLCTEFLIKMLRVKKNKWIKWLSKLDLYF